MIQDRTRVELRMCCFLFYLFCCMKTGFDRPFPFWCCCIWLKFWPHLAQSLTWWRKTLKASPRSSGIFVTFLWPISPLAVFFSPSFMHYTRCPVFLTSQIQMSMKRTTSKSHLSTARALLQSSTILKAVIIFFFKWLSGNFFLLLAYLTQ